MNPTLAKITAATETLPDYAREVVENDLIEQAEASAKAWAAEKQHRSERTMDGLKDLEEGRFMTIEEFDTSMDAFFAELDRNAPAAE